MLRGKKYNTLLKNSSAGHDEFPTFVGKLCVYSYIELLTFLINSSLKTGVFPSELKLARVVPIFKAGDSSALTNYRPISVLTFFAKVFEKIVYNKLLNFISDNNILYDHQYGFRKGRSTQQAIITLVDKCCSVWVYVYVSFISKYSLSLSVYYFIVCRIQVLYCCYYCYCYYYILVRYYG